MPLLSASELAAVQEVAESGMVTIAYVYHRETVETEDGRETVYPSTPDLTIAGWLYSEPSPVITVISGEAGLVNTYRWFCPVGTDIRSGDHLIISTLTYTVSDTTVDSTWPALLRCSLRLVE